jgi:hypothetical protein
MPKRGRLVAAIAIGSAAALIGALGTGLTVAGLASTAAGSTGVSFTSRSAVAELVAHYTVSPGQRPVASSRTGSSDSRQLPRLNKHGSDSVVRSSRTNRSAAPQSDNTNTDSTASTSTAAGSVKASFIGQQSSATTCSYFGPGCNPPDMAVAASTGLVLQGVNTQWEVLDTAGNVQAGWPVSAQAFFGVPNVTDKHGNPCDTAHLSQPFLSDPRALYDRADNRFWAAMLQVENGLGIAPDCPFKSVYYVAVSSTSDPRGAWNVYEFNMSLDSKFAADFTQIGINGEAVYFSANMFGPASGLNNGFYAEIFEANKAQMEDGQAAFTAAGFFNMKVTGPGNTSATGPLIADTLNPALNLDGSGGNGELFADTMDGPDPMTGHFCGFFGGGAADACSGLGLWRMTNPIAHDSGGAAPSLAFNLAPTKPYVFSAPSDQPSCNQCIDPSDLRISATPVVRGGVLYAAWETGLDNGTQVVPGIVWTSTNLSDVTGRSNYYNLSGDTSVSYPALMPDGKGNVVMLFDRMSNTVFPETRFIVSAGGQFHGTGTLLKAGETNYRPQLCGTSTLPVCRWGDFSAASFDGAGTIWVAGEYANQLNLGPPQNGRNWGTWIGAISAS